MSWWIVVLIVAGSLLAGAALMFWLFKDAAADAIGRTLW